MKKTLLTRLLTGTLILLATLSQSWATTFTATAPGTWVCTTGCPAEATGASTDTLIVDSNTCTQEFIPGFCTLNRGEEGCFNFPLPQTNGSFDGTLIVQSDAVYLVSNQVILGSSARIIVQPEGILVLTQILNNSAPTAAFLINGAMVTDEVAQVNFPILGEGAIRCCDDLIVITGGGNFGNVFNNPLAGLLCPGSINGMPLPITLKSFEGDENKEGITLNWTTSIEKDNNYFILERSKGFNQFEEIGTLNTKAPDGNSKEEIHYSFIDESPLPGTAYYRLKQIDKDGTGTYVGLIAFEAEHSGFSPHLFPNPAEDKAYLYLSSENTEDISIEVRSLDGKIKASYNADILAANKLLELELSNIEAGIYLLEITTNAHKETLRLNIK